jgi:hypothetical protein
MTTSVITKNTVSFNQSINTYKTKNKVDRYEWWFDLPTSDVSPKSPSVELDVENHKTAIEEFLKTNKVITLRSRKNPRTKNFRLPSRHLHSVISKPLH